MSEVNFRAQQAANKRKTFLLLASFGALMWLVVYAALTYMGSSTAGIRSEEHTSELQSH